ncbi:MAG TPA: hypothetical protein VL990_16890 [Acidobacteriaceae bacterium]|nr:hypothetical protein [Acidobacteriaceae bacterium]
MVWITLILGLLLMTIGIGGQIFGTRKSSTLAPQDRHARNWIFTVGTVVVALWVVAFSAAHFLRHHH